MPKSNNENKTNKKPIKNLYLKITIPCFLALILFVISAIAIMKTVEELRSPSEQSTLEMLDFKRIEKLNKEIDKITLSNDIEENLDNELFNKRKLLIQERDIIIARNSIEKEAKKKRIEELNLRIDSIYSSLESNNFDPEKVLELTSICSLIENERNVLLKD